MADTELASKLARRQQLIEDMDGVSPDKQQYQEKQHAEDCNHVQRSQDDTVNEVVSDMADEELKNRLARRQDIIEGKDVSPNTVKVIKSVYAEFHEFSRKQIKQYEEMFKK